MLKKLNQKMKRNGKRILSLILTFVLCFISLGLENVLPVSARASKTITADKVWLEDDKPVEDTTEYPNVDVGLYVRLSETSSGSGTYTYTDNDGNSHVFTCSDSNPYGLSFNTRTFTHEINGETVESITIDLNSLTNKNQILDENERVYAWTDGTGTRTDLGSFYVCKECGFYTSNSMEISAHISPGVVHENGASYTTAHVYETTYPALYVRIDTATLSSSNNFTYTWNCTDGYDYVVLEYDDTSYTPVSVTVDDTSYDPGSHVTGTNFTFYNTATLPEASYPQAPTKTVSGLSDDNIADVGDTLTYSINYYNHHTDADTITVTDTLDDSLTFVSASDGGTYDASTDTVTWTVPNAPGHEWGSVSFTATVNDNAKDTGIIKNSADVAVASYSPQTSDTVSVNVTPDVSISKSVSPSENLNIRDEVTYTITVNETVPSGTDKDITVTDSLPDGLTLKDVKTDTGDVTVNLEENSFAVDIPSLFYDDTVTITVTATVDDSSAGMVPANTATITDQYGHVHTSASKEIFVLTPALSIDKNVENKPYNVGDTVDYIFTVTQTEEGARAYDIRLTDELPEGMTFVSAVSEDTDITVSDDGTVITVPSLNYGETATVILTAKIGSSLVGQENVTNTVYMTDATGQTASDSAVISVLEPQVTIRKNVKEQTAYNVGDELTYIINVSQTVENAVDYDIKVSDTLPDGLTLTEIQAGNNARIEYVYADGSTGDSPDSDQTVTGFIVTYSELVYDSPEEIILRTTIDSSGVGKTVTNTAVVTDLYYDSDNSEEENEGHCVSSSTGVDILTPSLSIHKTAEQDSYYVNDTVNYTLTVSETTENARDFNVTVTDKIPEGMTLTEGSVLVNGTEAEYELSADNILTVTIPEISWNAPSTVTFGTVIGSELAQTEVTNTASVTDEYGTVNDDGSAISDSYTVRVNGPQLKVTKSSDNAVLGTGVFGVGDTITYTITVDQSTDGTSDYDIVVKDKLPNGLTPAEETPTVLDSTGREIAGATVAVDENTVTVNIPELDDNTTAVITVKAVIGASLAGSTFTNTATVTDRYNAEVSADATAYVRMPQLSIEKSVINGAVAGDIRAFNPGDTVMYKLDVSQTVSGTKDYAVLVTDTVPKGLAITGAYSPDTDIEIIVNQDDNSLWAIIPELTCENPVAIYVSAVVNTDVFEDNDFDGIITNTATVNDTYEDHEESDSADIQVLKPSLTVDKTSDSDAYNVGDSINYTVTVQQNVPGATDNDIVITDEIPDGLTLTDPESIGVYIKNQTTDETISVTDAVVSVDNNVLTVSVPSLSYGEMLILYYSVEINSISLAGTNTTNTASVADYVHNEVSATCDVYVRMPELSVNKTTDADTYGVGDTITYTIEVNQLTANVSDTGITVSDILPDGLTLTSVDAGDNGTISYIYNDESDENRSVIGFTVSYDELKTDSPETVTVTAIIEASAAGSTVTNTVTATDDYGNEVKSSASVYIIQPELNITKSVKGDGIYNAGETVTYIMKITQPIEGTVNTDINVSDILPDGLTATENAVIYLLNADGTVKDSADVSKSSTDGGDSAETPDENTDESDDSGLTVSVSKNGNLTACIPVLAYGETAVITWDVTINYDAVNTEEKVSTFITNTVTATDMYRQSVTADTTIEIRHPDIQVTKYAIDEPHNVGETISYKFIIDEIADNAVDYFIRATDTLPDGMSFVEDTITVSPVTPDTTPLINVSGNTLTVILNKLDAEEPVTVSFDAVIDDYSLAGTNVTNSVTVTDLYGDTAYSQATVSVLKPDITVSKTQADTQSVYNVGDTVVYDITVNETVTDAVDYEVIVADELPKTLQITKAYVLQEDEGETTDNNVDVTVDTDTNTVTGKIGRLSSDKPVTIRVEAVITSDAVGQEITNTVNVTDPYDNTASDSASFNVLMPGVSVNKTVSAGPYNVGDEIDYTLTLQETLAGAVDYDIQIYDKLPDELALKEGSISCSDEDAVINNESTDVGVLIPKLASGDTVTVKFTAVIVSGAGETVTNTVNVEDMYGNTDDSDVSINVLMPNISLNKSVSIGPYNLADTPEYTLTINETVVDAVDYDVVITDILPDGMGIVDGSVEISDENVKYDLKDGSLVITVPVLKYGTPVTVTFYASLAESMADSTVINTAYATDAYGNTDEDSGNIDVLKANLSIYKTADKTTYNAGDTITYTLTVQQNGPSAVAYNVVVMDTLPDGLTLQTITLNDDSGTVNHTEGHNSFTVVYPEINEGDPKTITVEALVTDTLVGKSFTNTAMVTEAVEGDSDSRSVTATVLQPELNIEKTSDNNTYNVGDTVTYAVNVTQTVENAVDYGVVMTDTLPDGMTLTENSVVLTGVEGTVNFDGNNVTAEIPTLAYGETAMITYTAVVEAPLVGQEVTNTAYAEDRYDNSQVFDSTTINISAPDLNIEKSVTDSGLLATGNSVKYQLTVTEKTEGTTDYDVVVSDAVPSGLTLKQDSVTVSGASENSIIFEDNSLHVTIPQISYGETVIITFEAQIGVSMAGKTISNTATARDTYGYVFNSNEAVFTVALPELNVKKSVSDGPYNVGDTITYKIDVSSSVHGITDYNIELTDILPDSVEAADCTVNDEDSSVSITGNKLTANIPKLDSDETITITIDAVLLSSAVGTSVINQAECTDMYGQTFESNTVEISALVPNVQITKTIRDGSYAVGGEITYDILVEETVNGAVDYGVIVTDTLPNGTSFKSVSCSDNSVNAYVINGELHANINTLRYGQPITVTLTLTVNDTALAGTSLENTAHVTDDYGNDSFSTATADILMPDISVSKSADSETYNVGDIVTWIIDVDETVANAIDYDVVLTDVLPEGLTLINIQSGDNGSVTKTADNSFTVTYPSLSYESPEKITVTAQINPSLVGKSFTNTVNVSDMYGNTASDSASSDVLTPDIQIEKTVSDAPYNAGDILTYTLIIRQTTEGAVDYDVTVTDELPSGLTLSGTPSVSGAEGTVTTDGENRVVTAHFDSISNEPAYVTIQAHIDSDAGGTKITNTARVMDTYGNTDSDEKTVGIELPELSIKKSSDISIGNVEDTVTYMIEIENTATGTTDYHVTVSDALPDGLTFETVTAETAGTVNMSADGSFTVTYATLPANMPEKIIVTAKINSDAVGKTVTNTAEIIDMYGNRETDSTDISVLEPDLKISKAVNKSACNVEDDLIYTIDINQTTENAVDYDVTVTDVLPDGLTLTENPVLSGVEGTVSINENIITVNIPVMTSDAQITVATKVNENAVGTRIENTAYVTDRYGHKADDTAVTSVISPDIAITKNVSGGTHNAGETVTYTLEVTQTVESAVDYNVIVTDILPDGLVLTKDPVITGTSGQTDTDGNTVTVTIPELTYGTVCTITLECEIGASLAGQTVRNTADVKDPYGNESSDSAVFDVLHPGISVVKTVDSDTYNVGDTVVYTLTITEPVADTVTQDVTVTDELPDGLTANGNITLRGVEGTVSISGNTYTVNIPVLKYGEIAVATIEATIDPDAIGTTIDNTAFASDVYADSDKSDAVIDVMKPELAVSVKGDGTNLSVNDRITYIVTINQTVSGAIARNVLVSDVLPDELELISVNSSDGTVSTSGNQFTVNVGDMSVSDTVTITIVAEAKTEAENIVNTVYAKGDYIEDVNDSWTVAVRAPGLNIWKTSDKSTCAPGDEVHYTIAVRNLKENDNTDTTTTAYNVTVTDTLPDSLTLVGVTDDCNGQIQINGNGFVITWPTLCYGDTIFIDVDAVVCEDTGNTDIVNTAYVSSDATEPVSDYAVINVKESKLAIETKSDRTICSVGDEITYTINVMQTITDVTAENVIITDTLPAGMEPVDVVLDGADGDILIDGNNLTVTIPKLIFGDTVVITVHATANEAGDSILNTAYATADYAVEVSDSAEITVLQPVLSVSKTSDRVNYQTGDDIIYTITARQITDNATAKNVLITDELPEGLDLVNVSMNNVDGNLKTDNNRFTVEYETLDSVSPAILTVTARANGNVINKNITNMVTVSASNAEDAKDDTDITVMKSALSVQKTADREGYNIGDTVLYTIQINENTPGTSDTDVRITDNLPGGLTLMEKPELSGVNGTVTVDGNTVVCNIPEIAYGEEAVITIMAEIGTSLSGTTVENTAHVSADISENMSDSAVINVKTEENEPDTGTPETGEPDTSEPDTGTPDTGKPDTTEPETETVTTSLGETLTITIPSDWTIDIPTELNGQYEIIINEKTGDITYVFTFEKEGEYIITVFDSDGNVVEIFDYTIVSEDTKEPDDSRPETDNPDNDSPDDTNPDATEPEPETDKSDSTNVPNDKEPDASGSTDSDTVKDSMTAESNESEDEETDSVVIDLISSDSDESSSDSSSAEESGKDDTTGYGKEDTTDYDKSSNETSRTSENITGTSAHTDDMSISILWIVLGILAVGGCGVGFVVYLRRKKD